MHYSSCSCWALRCQSTIDSPHNASHRLLSCTAKSGTPEISYGADGADWKCSGYSTAGTRGRGQQCHPYPRQLRSGGLHPQPALQVRVTILWEVSSQYGLTTGGGCSMRKVGIDGRVVVVSTDAQAQAELATHGVPSLLGSTCALSRSTLGRRSCRSRRRDGQGIRAHQTGCSCGRWRSRRRRSARCHTTRSSTSRHVSSSPFSSGTLHLCCTDVQPQGVCRIIWRTP